MKILSLLSCLFCTVAHANDLFVSVTEKNKTPTVTLYRINEKTLIPLRTKPIEGHVLPRIHKYTIVNKQLSIAGCPLTKGTEILFQTTVDETDFVVLRDEYNSWFGPLKLPLYLGGHPVQVSNIIIVKVASNGSISRKQLLSKEASYSWTATISQ